MVQEFIDYYEKKMAYLLIGCIVIILGMGIYTCFAYENRREAEKEIKDTISQLTFTEASRNKELENLQKLIEKKYISSGQKGVLYENIAAIYMLDNDSSMYMINLSYAVYQYKKAEQYEKAVSISINLAKYLAENFEFDVSKKIALKIVSEENKVYLKDPDIVRKAYMTLAAIYSKSGETDKALEACKIARTYILKNKKGKNFYNDCLKIIEARAYLQKGELKKTEKLLDSVRDKYYYTGDDSKYILIDYVLPFLEVDAKLNAYNKKYEEVINISKQYSSLCDDFENDSLKLNLLVSLINITKDSKEPAFQKMKEEAWNLYPKVMDERNSKYADNLVDSVDNLIEDLASRDNDIKIQWRFLGSVSCLVLFIFIVASQLKRVWRENCIDQLTGVCNRRQMTRVHQHHIKKKRKYGCIMMDIDNFKIVNDTYGHQRGDKILIGVAKAAKRYTSQNITVIRYGGEEFLIFYRTDNYNLVTRLAEKIRYDIEKTNWVNDLKITISVGTSFSTETDDPINLADKRLYCSKARGKNCVTTEG